MKNVILIHGWNTKEEFFDPDKPTMSNDHWFPWLTKQLMVRGIKTDAPEMTQYDLTTYESWKREVERFDITTETTLVGHSCGAGFILRYLSENDIKIDKAILVAPWLGIDFGQEFNKDFFDFKIDRKVVNKTNRFTVIYSDDDFEVIKQSVEIIRREVDDVHYIPLKNKGHFTKTSLGGDAFPEVLQEVING